jgi:hypothetical protein
VRQIFCPICERRTPHAPRPTESGVAIGGLLLLTSCALLWTALVQPLTGAIALCVSVVLLLRGITLRFRIHSCSVCGRRLHAPPRAGSRS